jgi:hypothetical protein
MIKPNDRHYMSQVGLVFRKLTTLRAPILSTMLSRQATDCLMEHVVSITHYGSHEYWIVRLIHLQIIVTKLRLGNATLPQL